MFHRIELWRVSGQVFKTYAFPLQFTESSTNSTVGRQSIPDHNDWSAQLFLQFEEKHQEVIRFRVMPLDFKVLTNPASFGIDGQCCDAGKAIMSVPRSERRRASPFGPGSSKKWLEHKPRFINENQASIRF
jgi:hypothetical protein